MKDRDIEEDEINKITARCPTREKAFFTIMRQSGLKPHTIKQLKIKDVEMILQPDTPTPCKIRIPRQKYPTFIGYEAINYLKQYLETRERREDLTSSSLLFTALNKANKEINTKNVSRTFREKTRKLHLPDQLQLSSLTEFYINNTKEYRTQLKKYSTKDDGSHRELYRKYAMPFLEIEELTPWEMHQLTERLTKIQPLVEFVNSFDDYENLKTILNFLKDEILAQHPDKKFRPINAKLSPYIGMKLKEIAKTMGITEKEALKRLFANNVETMKKTEDNWAKTEKRLIDRTNKRRTSNPKQTK